MAGILADGEIEQLRAFGESLGYLFQLTDDLLDVKGDEKAMGKTLGKDEREEKTYLYKGIWFRARRTYGGRIYGKMLSSFRGFERC